ncbi:MAG: hypothetical protein QOH35_4294 [Acidobacteriaceae bacterium]|jgi:hypothetical protein|nr:hypothetical protein [Acidobacteriaceae bacterium]
MSLSGASIAVRGSLQLLEPIRKGDGGLAKGWVDE